MRKILIIVLALNLTACSTIQNYTDEIKANIQKVVTPDNFDTVTALYGSALAAGVAYRSLCEKKVINKSCWNVIASMQPYEFKAYNAYIILKNYVKSNPNADASSFVQIAKDAISAFKSYQIANGVN